MLVCSALSSSCALRQLLGLELNEVRKGCKVTFDLSSTTTHRIDDFNLVQPLYYYDFPAQPWFSGHEQRL